MEKEELGLDDIRELVRRKTGKNTTDSAANMLGAILETFAGDIAEEAIHVAEKEDQEEVTAGDVKEALEPS